MSQTSGNYGAIPGLNTLPLNGISIAGAGLQEDVTMHSHQGLTIRVVPATGGTIVSIRKDNTFGSTGDLYVINEESDLGAELGKIITLHYLKT